VTRLVFFVGKGGVGKTTLSAAYALWLVSAGRRKLTVWEMDSEALFRELLAGHKNKLVEVIERGSLFTADEISSLLETTLPGMSEVAALLAIQEAVGSAQYSDIVVDTAPFGHTLRLFSLPQQFLRLLNFLQLSTDRDRVLAEHFGGKPKHREIAFIAAWRTQMQALEKAISTAELFLVTTAERFAFNESVRSIRELRQLSAPPRLQAVVLNRAVLSSAKCACCRRLVEAGRRARVELQKQFPAAQLVIGEDPGAPILGVQGLRAFGLHVFSRKPLNWKPATLRAKAQSGFRLIRAAWPKLNTPLSFVLGKGGVGKTTLSAGLGFYSRTHAPDPVEICSVDPAPSLDDIFRTRIGNQPVRVLNDSAFYASELDSVALFRGWIQEIKAEVESATTGQYSSVQVDLSYERRLFSELLEIVPPGLDEVLAVFRIVELLSGARKKVIIDMAATGHALQLLRTPGQILVWARLLLKSLASHRKLALARDAAVKIAELEVRARELSKMLSHSRQAEIFSVMLAEPLPDRETERLFAELEALGLSTNTIFVNRVLLPERAARCQRCRRAEEWQHEVLADLKKHFRDKKIYAIRNFDREISGKRGLRELASELWRLN
jgi:arsenite/tail-anchored protein-transporting ATPase